MIRAILSILKLLGGGKAIAEQGMNIWAKSKDVDLQKFKSQTEATQVTAVAAIKNDEVKTQVYGTLMVQAMNHRVFWIAWALFVLPGGIHHAASISYFLANMIAPSIAF